MAEPGGVKLPGVGRVPRKWLVIVGVASIGSIAYFAYRRKGAAAVPAADGSTGQIDPLTGDVAGSAQDQMDLAALQDSSAYGTGTAGGYYAGSGALGTSGVNPPVPGTGGFTTNGQWAQQAEADLGGIGVDQLALAAALGHYLTGSPLSSAEQSLVDQAIAEEGYPPVAGPSGYPPAMHATPAGGGTGGGGTGTGTGRLARPGGVHLTLRGKTGVRVQWTAVPGAAGYVALARQGGANGTTVNGPFTVTQPVANFGGLRAGTRYTALIWPSDAADPGGISSNQPHAEFAFTTPR